MADLVPLRSLTLGILFLSLLSSCAFTPYNTQFDCPVGKGEPCTRLTTINKMIDRGELGVEDTEAPRGLTCGANCSRKFQSQEVRVTYFPEKEPEIITVEESTLSESSGEEEGIEPNSEESSGPTEEFQA